MRLSTTNPVPVATTAVLVADECHAVLTGQPSELLLDKQAGQAGDNAIVAGIGSDVLR